MSDDVEIILHLPLPDMDALGLHLCDITKALHERDPELVHHGFLGGSFGYGGRWSSPVFEMRPDGDDDCDCGQENVQGENMPPEPKKGTQTKARMDAYYEALNDLERRFPHLPTCILVRPHFRHHASGFEVRWYKYIGRSMETKGTPPDLKAMAAECVADVKAGGRSTSSPDAGGGGTYNARPVE